MGIELVVPFHLGNLKQLNISTIVIKDTRYLRKIKQIIEKEFVLTCISLIIIDMSTYIIHYGYCIEYGKFSMGLFFHYLTPSIWICFETPYSHIPGRIFKPACPGS